MITDEIGRQAAPSGRGKAPVQTRVHRIECLLVPQYEPDAHRSLGLRPIRDDLVHCRIGTIDGLHDPKFAAGA